MAVVDIGTIGCVSVKPTACLGLFWTIQRCCHNSHYHLSLAFLFLWYHRTVKILSSSRSTSTVYVVGRIESNAQTSFT